MTEADGPATDPSNDPLADIVAAADAAPPTQEDLMRMAEENPEIAEELRRQAQAALFTADAPVSSGIGDGTEQVNTGWGNDSPPVEAVPGAAPTAEQVQADYLRADQRPLPLVLLTGEKDLSEQVERAGIELEKAEAKAARESAAKQLNLLDEASWDSPVAPEQIRDAIKALDDATSKELKLQGKLQKRFEDTSAWNPFRRWVAYSDYSGYTSEITRIHRQQAELLGRTHEDTRPTANLDQFIREYVESPYGIFGNILGGIMRAGVDLPYRINDAIVTGVAAASGIPLPDDGLTTRPGGDPSGISGALSYGVASYAPMVLAPAAAGAGFFPSVAMGAAADAALWNPLTEPNLSGSVRQILEAGRDQTGEPSMLREWAIEALRPLSSDLATEAGGEFQGRAAVAAEGILFNLLLLGGVRLLGKIPRGAGLPTEAAGLRLRQSTETLASRIGDESLPERVATAFDEFQQAIGDIAPDSSQRAASQPNSPAARRVTEAAERLSKRLAQLANSDPAAAAATAAARFGDEGLTLPALSQWAARLSEREAFKTGAELSAYLAIRHAAQRRLLEDAANRNLSLSRTPTQIYTLANEGVMDPRIRRAPDVDSQFTARADAEAVPQGSDELARPKPRDFAGQYREGLAATARDHEFGFAVEVKDLPFYEDPRVRMYGSQSGDMGVAVSPEGDIVSVHKHPDSTGNINAALAAAAPNAITLDAFDINGMLPSLYSKHGFKPGARVRWNDAFAPPGWNYETAGRPDVVLMVRDPDGVSGLPDVPSRDAGGYAAIREQVPLFNSWDEAVESLRPAKQNIGALPRADTATATLSNFSARRIEAEDVFKVEQQLESMGLGLDRLREYQRSHAYAILTDRDFGFNQSPDEARRIANAITSGFGFDPTMVLGPTPRFASTLNGQTLYQRNRAGLTHTGTLGDMTAEIEGTTSTTLGSAIDIPVPGHGSITLDPAAINLRNPGIDTPLRPVAATVDDTIDSFGSLPSVKADNAQPMAYEVFREGSPHSFTDADLDLLWRQTLEEMMDDGVIDTTAGRDPQQAWSRFVGDSKKFSITFKGWSVGEDGVYKMTSDKDGPKSFATIFGAQGSRWKQSLEETGLDLTDGVPIGLVQAAAKQKLLPKSLADEMVEHMASRPERRMPFQPPNAKFWNNALTAPGGDRFRFWYEISSDRLFGGDRPLINLRGEDNSQELLMSLAGVIAETSPRTQVDTNMVNALLAFGAYLRGRLNEGTALFAQKMGLALEGGLSNMRGDVPNYKVPNFNKAITRTIPQAQRPAGEGIPNIRGETLAYDRDLSVMDVVMAGLFRLDDSAWSSFDAYNAGVRYLRRVRNEINRRMSAWHDSLPDGDARKATPWEPFELAQVQALPWTFWNSRSGKSNPDSAIKDQWEEWIGKPVYEGSGKNLKLVSGQEHSTRTVDYPSTVEKIIEILEQHPKTRHFYEGPDAKYHRDADGKRVAAYLDREVLTSPGFHEALASRKRADALTPTMRLSGDDLGLSGDEAAMSAKTKAFGRLGDAMSRLAEDQMGPILQAAGVPPAAIENAEKAFRSILDGIIEPWRRVVRKSRTPYDYRESAELAAKAEADTNLYNWGKREGPKDPDNAPKETALAHLLHAVIGPINKKFEASAKVRVPDPSDFGVPGGNPNRLRSPVEGDWTQWEDGSLGRQFGDMSLSGPFTISIDGQPTSVFASPLFPVSNWDEGRLAAAAAVASSGVPQRLTRVIGEFDPAVKSVPENASMVRMTIKKPLGVGAEKGKRYGWNELLDQLPASVNRDGIEARTVSGFTELLIPGSNKQEIADAVRRLQSEPGNPYALSDDLGFVEIDPQSFRMSVEEAEEVMRNWRRDQATIESSSDWWRSVTKYAGIADLVSPQARRRFVEIGSTMRADEGLPLILRSKRLTVSHLMTTKNSGIANNTFWKDVAAGKPGTLELVGDDAVRRIIEAVVSSKSPAKKIADRQAAAEAVTGPMREALQAAKYPVDSVVKALESWAFAAIDLFNDAKAASRGIRYDFWSADIAAKTEPIRNAGEVAATINNGLDDVNRSLGLSKDSKSEAAKAMIAAEKAGQIPSRGDLRFQQRGDDIKGVMWAPDAGGESFVRGFSSADRTTGIHELAHSLRVQATSRGGRTAAISKSEWSSIEKYFGVDGGKWTEVADERFAEVMEEALTTKSLPGDMPADAAAVFLRGMAELRDLGLDYKAAGGLAMGAGMREALRDMESLPLPIRTGDGRYMKPVDWSDLIKHAKMLRDNGESWQDVIRADDVLAHARIFQSKNYPGMVMTRDRKTGRIKFDKSLWAASDDQLRDEMRKHTHLRTGSRKEMFETMAFFEDFVRSMRNTDPILVTQSLTDAREGGWRQFARLVLQPDGEVHQLLNQMMKINLSTEQLSDRILAARLFMFHQLNETLRIAKQAKKSGQLVDHALVQREFLVFQQAQHHVAQLLTQTGRALRSVRDPVKLPTREEIKSVKRLDEFWTQLGRDQRVGPELTEMLDGLTLPRHAHVAATVITNANKAGPAMQMGTLAAAVGNEIYVNALLSAPRTFVGLTTASPAMMMFVESAEHLAGAMIRRDGDQIRAVARDLRRKWQDLGVSFRYAVRAFMDEEPRFIQPRADRRVGLNDRAIVDRAITAENFGLKDDDLGGWLINMTGKAVRFPSRAIMATDEFFRQLQGRNGIYAKAYDEYIAEAVAAAEETAPFASRQERADFVADLTDAANNHAQEAVDRTIRDGTLRDRHQIYREAVETPEVANAPTPYDKAMATVAYMQQHYTRKHASMIARGSDRATRTTFQTPLEPKTPAKYLQTLVDSLPMGRVLVPFFRTPMQIFRRFGGWSPTTFVVEGADRIVRAFDGKTRIADMPVLGQLHRWHMAEISSGDPRRMAEARGRQAFGIGLITLAATLAYEGRITGAGPKDRDRRALWLKSNQPYSIRVGDSWVSYGKMAPASQWLGLAADSMELLAAEEFRGGINAEQTDLVTGLIYGMGQQVRNMPMLQGLNMLMNAIERPHHGTFASNILHNTVVAATPYSSLQRATNQATDGGIYELRSIVDAYRARTWFGDAGKVAAARTPLGEPLNMYPEGNTWQPWVNLVNPMMFVRSTTDPVYQAINETGVYLAMPNKIVDGVDFSLVPVPNYPHSAWDWWMERIGTAKSSQGRTLRQELESLILPTGDRHAQWQSLMAGQRFRPETGEDTPAAAVIKKIVQAYQTLAFAEMRQASPEAMRQWVQAKQARQASYQAASEAAQRNGEAPAPATAPTRPTGPSTKTTRELVESILEARR